MKGGGLGSRIKKKEGNRGDSSKNQQKKSQGCVRGEHETENAGKTVSGQRTEGWLKGGQAKRLLRK